MERAGRKVSATLLEVAITAQDTERSTGKLYCE